MVSQNEPLCEKTNLTQEDSILRFFQGKYSPLTKMELPKNRTKKPFEMAEIWQFEVLPPIGPEYM